MNGVHMVPSTHQSLVWGMLLLGGLFLLEGCDPTVDVLEPSEQYQYSLFAALNVAADTQVVRVEPIGDTTQVGSPPELEARVILKNLDAGTQVRLQDTYETVGQVATVHNFRTTHALQAGTSYRLIVQKEGRPVTTATTTTPKRPPTLLHSVEGETQPFLLPCEFDAQGNPTERQNTFSVRAKHLDHLAAVKVYYPLGRSNSAPEGAGGIDYLDAAEHRDGGGYRLPIFYGQDLHALFRGTENRCVPRSAFVHPFATVVVAAGGPDWPQWREASLDNLARPDTFSNVKGGHGFVGAIYTDTVRVPIEVRE